MDVPSDPYPEPIYDPEAILALIYTSGTTGRPKGAVLTHADILANVHHLNYWMPYVEGSVYLHAAPMFHIADFPVMFAAPAFGACQVTIPKFSPRSFCETVEHERVRHTVLVPTMINLLTQFPELTKYDLTSLEVLGYGGSPMAPNVIHRTREVLPHLKLIQVYGLSETGFLTGLKDHEHTGTRLTSCGRSCPGVDMRIVDESGKEVEAGKTGELAARGANVMRSYWNNPQETALAFRDGLFRTGDVGVREASVFGIPDPQWGELVMAYIVLKPGKSLSADELITYCRRNLANYKIPRRVEFSETELPKSGSGKILKRVLRERFWSHQERAVS